MDSSFANLTQAELLLLSLEATKRGDSGHSMAYLKEAAARADASGQVHFLLGSEYAQIGLMGEAATHFERAVALAPDFPIARFQLGLLQLTSAQPDAALQSWAPLAALGDQHPLAVFSQGLRHLIRDEFADCIATLERGIQLNTENDALNADMQRVIERVKALPPDAGVPAAAAPDETPEGHLFLNAYTGGKVH
jgi:tetratricopeptide (TPR) repeat protein